MMDKKMTIGELKIFFILIFITTFLNVVSQSMRFQIIYKISSRVDTNFRPDMIGIKPTEDL